MKYIVMENLLGEEPNEAIFTFPNSINHDCMEEACARIKNQTHGNWERVPRIPVSAGFVDSKGNCYGESESLGLESRPEEDTALLAKAYAV